MKTDLEFELTQPTNAEVIGSGHNGFVYKLETTGGDFAISIMPPRNCHGYEIDLAARLCELLETNEMGLVTHGFLLPCAVQEPAEETSAVILQAIHQHTGLDIQATYRKLNEIYTNFQCSPTVNEGRFARLFVDRPNLLSSFMSDQVSFDIIMKALSDLDKIQRQHIVHVYPFLEDSPKSLRDELLFQNGIGDNFTFLKWLATQIDTIHSLGYVHRDIATGNVLKYKGRWLLADHKECKPLTRAELMREKRMFSYLIMVMLASPKIETIVVDVIQKMQIFNSNAFTKSRHKWLEAFYHGVQLQHMLPPNKNTPMNETLLHHALQQSGYSDEVIRFIETYEHSQKNFKQFVEELFVKIENPTTIRMKTETPQKRRHRH